MKRNPSSDSLKKAKSPSPPSPKGKTESPGHKMRLLPPDFRAGPHDVICGRGKKCYNHEGNERFRLRVERMIGEYARAKSKIDKSGVLAIVVEQVRRASPNGGFVKQDTDGRWYEVGDFLAREKTSQAFRDALHHYYKSSNVSKKRRREAEGHSFLMDNQIRQSNMMSSGMTHNSFDALYGNKPIPAAGHQIMPFEPSINSFRTNNAYQQQGAPEHHPATVQNHHGGSSYSPDFYPSSVGAGARSATLNNSEGVSNNYPTLHHHPLPQNASGTHPSPRAGGKFNSSLVERDHYQTQNPRSAGLLLQKPSRSHAVYGSGGQQEFYTAEVNRSPAPAELMSFGRRKNVLAQTSSALVGDDGHFTQVATSRNITTMKIEMVGDERVRRPDDSFPLSRSDSFHFRGPRTGFESVGHERDEFSVGEQEMHHSLPAIPNFEMQNTFQDRSLPAIHLRQDEMPIDASPFNLKRIEDDFITETVVVEKRDEHRSLRSVELDLEPFPVTTNPSLDRFSFATDAEQRKIMLISTGAKKLEDSSNNSESDVAPSTLNGQSSHMNILPMRARPASVPPMSPRKQNRPCVNDSLISCFDMTLTGHSIFSNDSNPFEPVPFEVSGTERHAEGSHALDNSDRHGFQPISKRETEEQDDTSSFAEG